MSWPFAKAATTHSSYMVQPSFQHSPQKSFAFSLVHDSLGQAGLQRERTLIHVIDSIVTYGGFHHGDKLRMNENQRRIPKRIQASSLKDD
jgi:hypothetical protein